MAFKKGVTDIIAMVLLIGFAIASAAMVYNWSVKQTESLSEHAVSFIEGDLKCADVEINIVGTGSPNKCSQLTIYNQGYHSIDQFVIRRKTSASSDSIIIKNDPGLPLLPKSSMVKSGWTAYVELSVVPIVDLDGKLIGCEDRSITLKCL